MAAPGLRNAMLLPASEQIQVFFPLFVVVVVRGVDEGKTQVAK